MNGTIYDAARWAGLCARSESRQPHEWPYLIWVMRHRTWHPRYPSSYRSVVLQPRQFSWFNRFGSTDTDAQIIAEGEREFGDDAISEASKCAGNIIYAPRWQAPFGPNVLNFWSPRSRTPPGSLPPWDFSKLRVLDLPIDPWRFLLAEEVSTSHPSAGPPADRIA